MCKIGITSKTLKTPLPVVDVIKRRVNNVNRSMCQKPKNIIIYCFISGFCPKCQQSGNNPVRISSDKSISFYSKDSFTDAAVLCDTRGCSVVLRISRGIIIELK